MDIQEELNAFKEVAQSKGWNTDGETTQTNYRFYCLTTNSGWEMWQVAKAQKVAVPEGFVLVERDLIQSIHQSCVNCLDIDFKPVFKAAVSTIRDSVKPLIEAQEQIDISIDSYTPMQSRSKEQVG